MAWKTRASLVSLICLMAAAALPQFDLGGGSANQVPEVRLDPLQKLADFIQKEDLVRLYQHCGAYEATAERAEQAFLATYRRLEQTKAKTSAMSEEMTRMGVVLGPHMAEVFHNTHRLPSALRRQLLDSLLEVKVKDPEYKEEASFFGLFTCSLFVETADPVKRLIETERQYGFQKISDPGFDRKLQLLDHLQMNPIELATWIPKMAVDRKSSVRRWAISSASDWQGGSPLETDVLARLLAQAASDTHATVRELVPQACQALPSRQATPIIARLLADPVKGVREAAQATVTDIDP